MPAPARVDPLFVEFQLALAGRYSLDRELGRGGMGVVYLARDVQLDRPVAIKVLPPERALDPDVRERFLREARLAAKLSHPHIVPIFAVDEVAQFVFYVMAYVDGETLGQRVRTRGPMASSELTRLMREVAWALGHAHAQGIVHRDVKPDNILLERGTGRALVTDFGIAAAQESVDAEVAGTPEYMSPEQALGNAVDARSDVYALGATAYFAGLGRAPFHGARAVDVLAQHVAGPTPVVAGAGTAMPRRLAHLIEKCLAKEPAGRPQSALALAEQLGVAVEDRREIPATLRAFVKRDGRIVSSGGIFMAVYMLLGLAIPFSMTVGPLVTVGIISTLLVGAPFAALVFAARRLLRRGYELPDLRVAFEREIEILREEFAATGLKENPRLERIAGVAAVVFGGLLVANLLLVTASTAISAGPVAAILPPVLGMAALSSLLLRFRLRNRRPHSAPEGWSKIWLGKIGRAAFAVARKLGGAPVEGAATTHRATELAIGMAASELFASLPRETRRELADVPRIIESLQRDAELLRTHHQRLQDALADAGEEATDAKYADVRRMRDELGERHKEVVSTLERMRLDLLRLHAGALTVDGVTTQMGLAGDVAQEVRRLLAARGEVERVLRS